MKRIQTDYEEILHNFVGWKQKKTYYLSIIYDCFGNHNLAITQYKKLI